MDTIISFGPRPVQRQVVTRFSLLLLASLTALAMLISLCGCGTSPAPAPAAPPVALAIPLAMATSSALAKYPQAAPVVQTITAAIRSVAGKEAPSPERLSAAITQWIAPLVPTVPGIDKVAQGAVADYTRAYPTIAKAQDALPQIEGYAQVIESAAAR